MGVVLAAAACGGGQEADALVQQPRACDLVDLAIAASVIGAEAMNPGDSEDMVCTYVNPGVATLTVQLDQADMYDRVTIQQPHAPADVGDRGRSNRAENGIVSVQFQQGAYSMSLGARYMGTEVAPDYLPALLDAARQAASRLP